MKSFFNLIQEVQKQGKCHHCGGCVTFCSAINYSALKFDETGKPCYTDIEKCIECGICYMVCPEVSELDKEIKKRAQWSVPAGRIIGTSVARAKDPIVQERGTDGGVVTAILLHLLETGRINGAIVSKNTKTGRVPCLATSKEEILDSAGTHFEVSPGMANFADEYSTFSPSIKALKEMRKEGVEKIAFVGTPCQINTIRKMEALGIVPADSIEFCLGLFCAGHFIFHDKEFHQIEKKYGFKYRDIESLNIKTDFILNLESGEQIIIPLEQLDIVKRTACNLCNDFSAEYADIAFGGLGAEKGFTTIVTRTPLGRAVLAEALEKVLDPYKYEDNPKYATNAENAVLKTSANKKEKAESNLINIDQKGISVIG